MFSLYNKTNNEYLVNPYTKEIWKCKNKSEAEEMLKFAQDYVKPFSEHIGDNLIVVES